MAPAPTVAYLKVMLDFVHDYPSPLDESRRRLHKFSNAVHTWALLATSIGLLVITVWALAGPEGIVWTALVGAISLWSVSRVTPELILRLYRARPLPAHVFADGNKVVAALARRAELPAAPQLYYVPSRNMNAFAVGRSDRAAIAVSDGLIRGLTLRQFAGVVAHEISHIRNGDVKVMALADMVSRMTSAMTMVGLAMILFFAPAMFTGDSVPWLGILLLIFAPHLTNLLQLALSRAREYDADLDAVGLTGDPEGLASALQTLERHQGAMWERLMVPGGGRIPDPSLLRTHPKTEDRVKRLLSLRRPSRPPDFARHGTSVPSVPASITPVVHAPRIHRTGVWY